MNQSILPALCLFLFVAVECPARQEAPKAKAAREYKFDGIRLGDSYLRKAWNRKPYNTPCDNDPIRGTKLRMMVYGALACRGMKFPQKTTVMFYVDYDKENRRDYDKPIRAFGYLYGSYFNDKTDFPLKPMDKLAKAKKIFGKPLKSYQIKGWKQRLDVHEFAGEVHVLAKRDTIIGFVFGKQSNRLHGVMQMYGRYTPHDPELPDYKD